MTIAPSLPPLSASAQTRCLAGRLLLPLAMILSPGLASIALGQAPFNSIGTGNWDNTAIWNPTPGAGGPQTGAGQTAIINTGDTITRIGGVGLPGSGDLGAAGNGHIILEGGSLTQNAIGNWVRIGHVTNGSMTINSGAYHFVNAPPGSSGNPNFQVGIRGATGFLTIGDGTGAPGSALFDLRHNLNGDVTGVNPAFNLAAAEGGQPNGIAGHVVVNSDGLIEGANATTRVGQAASAEVSTMTLQNGGRFNVRGTLEAGGSGGSKGLITVTGAGSLIDQSGGDLVIGWFGTGEMRLVDGGLFQRSNNADIRVGRENTGNGTLIVDNATLLQGSLDGGGNFVPTGGDFRIGEQGGSVGVVTIRNGGLVQRGTGNWSWVGQSGNGTLNLESGGQWRDLGGNNLRVANGGSATGTINISGPIWNSGTQLGTLLETHVLSFGDNGNAVANQTGGTVRTRDVFHLSQGAGGQSVWNMSGGEIVALHHLYVSSTGSSPANPNAMLNMSGSAVVNHQTSNDFRIGQGAGSYGRVTMSGDAVINSNREFVIGQDNGSRGELIMTGNSRLIQGAPPSGTSDLRIGRNGRGLVDIGNGARIERSHGNWAWVGEGGTGDGTLLIRDGGTWNSTDSGANLRVANNNGSQGLVRVETGGVLNNAGTIVMSDGGGTATLMVNGTLSSSNTVQVGTTAAGGAGSATFGGTGTVNSNVFIGQRGILSPGDSLTNPTGNLSLFGSLTFQAAADWDVHVVGGSSSMLTLSGSLGNLNDVTLGGTVSNPAGLAPMFMLNQTGGAAVNGQFANTMSTGSVPAFWNNLFPDADGFVNVDGTDFAIFYSADFPTNSFTGGNDIALGLVPEPGRTLLLALAALSLMARRRR